MIELAIVAAAIAVGFFIVMFKMGLRRVLGYDLFVDVSLTVLLMMMFSGSFSGMVVALMSGLVISVVLLVLRKFIGYEKYEERYVNNTYHSDWIRYRGWIA